MEQESGYVSCIKLNGLPILPPMMTENVRAEMKRYKEQAVNIETKLKAFKQGVEINGSNGSTDNIHSDDHSTVEIDTESILGSTPNVSPTKDSQALQTSPEEEEQKNLCSDNEIQESWKPQVPKTLNVVPVVLTVKQCVPIKTDIMSSVEQDKNDSKVPTLVRQGSYILETPSPVLLARMKTEGSKVGYAYAAPNETYIPTPTGNVSKRREWNILQAKTEWESKLKPQLVCDIEQSSKKTNHLSIESARSPNCIQTMPTDEAKLNGYRKKAKLTSRTSISTNLGGSLDNLNCKTTKDKILMNKSFDENILRESNEYVVKRTTTSEKLLKVLTEIEESHKKQMLHLIAKQKREQSLLQEEFERQQLLLLQEIKKSFPGLFDEKNGFKFHILPNEIAKLSPENVKFQPLKNIACPLDMIYSRYENVSSSNASCEFKENDVSTSRKLKTDKREKITISRRRLFPLDSKTTRVPVMDSVICEKHIKAATIINAYARGYLVRRLMKTERVIALRNTYKEALHCMLKLHVDAPLDLPELHFLHRLQLQCDGASMNIVELFAQSPSKRMQIIANDREIKKSRQSERPQSARSYSFATQRTLARKKLKEMEEKHRPVFISRSSSTPRCQTSTSDVQEKLISPTLNQNIQRNVSARNVRKPWR